jgi:Plasmid stabilization system protein
MKYRISKDARRDLDDLFLYWAKRVSVEVAERLIDNITERFWLLGEHPVAGRAADDIAPGVKCFPAGKYLIYYRKKSGAIDILHIFHGARDQKQAFQKGERR